MNSKSAVLLRCMIAVCETVAEADALIGAPSGPMYAAFQAGMGLSLESYQNLMAGCTSSGLLRLSGNCYHITDKGREFIAKVNTRA